jgi:hypothetical protein
MLVAHADVRIDSVTARAVSVLGTCSRAIRRGSSAMSGSVQALAYRMYTAQLERLGQNTELRA